MFKEYEVVFRATVMTTADTEKEVINRLHYQLSSAIENIDGLLVGSWQLQTLTTEKANETTDTTKEN